MQTQVVSDRILPGGRVASEVAKGILKPVVDLVQSQLIIGRL